jgi:hypothetical protein
MDPSLTKTPRRKRTGNNNRQFSLSRLLTIVIYAQYAIIILLLVALSSEYQSSPGFQAWVLANAAPVGYLLNYYIASFLVVIVMVTNFAFHARFAKRVGL